MTVLAVTRTGWLETGWKRCKIDEKKQMAEIAYMPNL